MAPKISLILILCCALGVSTSSSCFARPPHKKALTDYFGPYLAKKLNDCQTCHLPDKPGVDPAAAGKPHNPFGARLKAAKIELRKLGKPTDIPARLEFIAEEDCDGDGVSNIIELLSGHFPGDPNGKPTPAEIIQGREKLADFQSYRRGYPWKPFARVERPAVPEVKKTAWVRNPIDAFIATEHEARSLKPRAEASKVILLRRVYLDLIGLPPTPEQIHAFLVDTSPDAYEKVVEKLLTSPQYGERWGRHWMDVWRYSDWAGWGNQVRDSQPHIWRWRDWIIEGLNQDKGYDRMILEMLAADELCPEDSDALRATGFVVRNFKLLSRERWLEETVEHTAQAFLGITLGCARCHDHMFDPIMQKEYYQVRAIFEPHNVRIDRLPGQFDTNIDGLARVYDADLQAKTVLYFRGDERTPDKTPLAPGVPEVLGGRFPEVKPVSLPAFAYAPDKRPSVIEDLREERRQEVGKAQERFEVAGPAEREIAQLDLTLARAKQTALEMLLRAEALEDAGRKNTPEWENAAMMAFTRQQIVKVLQAQREVLVLMRAPLPAEEAARAELEKKRSMAKKTAEEALTVLLLDPSENYQRRRVSTYPQTSTGRRSALARWIVDRDNPLAARVAMNHIWLRHFGQAIVPSVFDFGQNGRRPTHAALLDWLAAEFMDRHWSMKAMHRLIVTSNTYRMASTSDPDNTAIDKDNVYLWRMPSRRMEAEVVRDCLFYQAGTLDLKMGGADIDCKQGLTIPRRSIYFRHAAEKRMEFLAIFDGPGVTECYERRESVMPQQALALFNSELTHQHARVLARRLTISTGSDPDAFTLAAFAQVLSRPPTSEEIAECVAFLKDRTERNGSQSSIDLAQRARESLVHVLMNHNDFLTVR